MSSSAGDEVTGEPPYFDAHSDLLSSVVEERAQGRNRVIEEDFLPGMETSDIRFRVAAIFIDDDFLPEMALRRGMKIAHALHQEIAETDGISLATSTSDIDPMSPETTFILGMEGAEPLQGDLEMLDIFHRLGLRLLTLTHSRRNQVADGCFYEPKRTGTRGGVTDFGVKVIELLDELGIVLDVSHLNTEGFWDVMDLADGPVIASHSNCKDLHDHLRNLTDEQLEAIAKTGGVVGLTPVADFVGDDEPTIEEFLDHVERAVDVAGIEHVGFGFDFFEYLGAYRTGWDEADPPFGGTAVGIGGDDQVGDLAPALRDRGFDDDAIDRFAYRNFIDVFRTILH